MQGVVRAHAILSLAEACWMNLRMTQTVAGRSVGPRCSLLAKVHQTAPRHLGTVRGAGKC